MVGTEVGPVLWRARPGAKKILVLECRVDGAEAEAEEDAAGRRASAGARLDDVGARRPLGYCRVLCSSTMSGRRSGTMNSTPR